MVIDSREPALINSHVSEAELQIAWCRSERTGRRARCPDRRAEVAAGDGRAAVRRSHRINGLGVILFLWRVRTLLVPDCGKRPRSRPDTRRVPGCASCTVRKRG